jgi:hypothetical protein
MPRLSTQKKVFQIKDPAFFSYFGGNSTATTEYMKKVKSELTNKDDKTAEDEKVIKWITNEFDIIHNAEDTKKRIGMETGAPGTKKSADGTNSNHFKNFKGKDENANPTKVRVPKIKGGSREIMKNSATYESVEEEISAGMYLIEYMKKK